MCSSIY